MPWRSAARTTACGNGTTRLATARTSRRVPRACSAMPKTRSATISQEWHSRIHPDDLERALAELQAHLDGRTQSLRVRASHASQGRRLALGTGTCRGGAARQRQARAGGRPVHRHLRAQAGAAGAARTGGRTAAACAARKPTPRWCRSSPPSSVHARPSSRECCNYPATRVRMLAHWYMGQFAPARSSTWQERPARRSSSRASRCSCRAEPASAGRRSASGGRKLTSGCPASTRKGTVIGHIACKHGKEIARELPHEAILKLFAVRASVEMERQFLERLRAGTSGAGSWLPPPLPSTEFDCPSVSSLAWRRPTHAVSGQRHCCGRPLATRRRRPRCA